MRPLTQFYQTTQVSVIELLLMHLVINQNITSYAGMLNTMLGVSHHKIALMLIEREL